MNCLDWWDDVFHGRGAKNPNETKPDEKLKTDRDMFNVPKDEQSAARKRILERKFYHR